MENLRNRYKFNNLRNSISSLDDTTSSLSRVGDLTGRVSNFGSFSGFGGSDLQTAASGHGGYGHHGGYEVCCENGVDFGTLLALLGGKPYSRLQNKRRGTLINFWAFFQWLFAY